MKLLDEKKFLKEIDKMNFLESGLSNHGLRIAIHHFLSKHLKDIKDEPHHPSGMDRDKIKIRNELRKELRKLDFDKLKEEN